MYGYKTVLEAARRGDTNEKYGVPKGSKSTKVVDHSVYAYFDIHVHV